MPPVAGHGGGAGLAALPFRAMRYDVDAVGGDLAPVLCPPYDVVTAQGRARLLAAHPLNLVRLTLPTARSPAAAARRLDAWLAEEVLRLDPDPSLTVVELDDGGGPVRGLVGVVPVDDRPGTWLLPHEDVVEAAVAERAALLGATRADLEPILLTVRGGLGEVVDAAAQEAAPSLSTRAAGLGLRLWTLPAAGWAAPVAEALAGRRALVVDGHHRLAAARRHRRLRRTADGPGPWDGVLALIVDADRRPLHLGAIHRHVDLPLPALLDAAPPPVRWERLPDGEAPLPDARGQVVAGDGRRWWLGHGLDRAAATGDDGRGARWHALDTAVLHEVWLPAAGVTDRQTTYHHSARTATAAARERGGSALLLHEVELDDVVDIARSGLTMPQKSTSFGPKPPSGLVMRRHREG